MAPIVPRGKKFAVVYNYTNEMGEVKQKWESGFPTEKEANVRKLEIELQQATGAFINPSDITLEDYLLKRWVRSIRKKDGDLLCIPVVWDSSAITSYRT